MMLTDKVINKTYQGGVIFLARATRAIMRARGADGYFCTGVEYSYHEWNGLKLTSIIFGAVGNINSGGNAELQTISKMLCFSSEYPVIRFGRRKIIVAPHQ